MGEYENERDSDGLWTVLDCLLGLVRGEDVPPGAKVLVTCHTGTVDIHNVFKNDTASFLVAGRLFFDRGGGGYSGSR